DQHRRRGGGEREPDPRRQHRHRHPHRDQAVNLNRKLSPRTLVAFLSLAASSAAAQEPLRVASPNGRNVVMVGVRDGGLFYSLDRDGKHILMPSRLGFAFRGADSLRSHLRVTGSSRATHAETWAQPWGE